MIKFPWRSTAYQEDQAGDLLQSLLQQPIPDERDPLRPVALRSTEEHRRQALRSFLLFTWFDRTLYHAERLLLVAVVAYFLFWLFDGYGRDWLHEQGYGAAIPPVADAPLSYAQQLPASALTTGTAITATGVLTDPAALDRSAVSQKQAPLPFTPDGIAEADEPGRPVADYLSPRAAHITHQRVDTRPQRLIIPGIGLDTPVQEVFIEDGVWQVAEYAAGYHHGSALPGEAGNMVMAGHAGLRGAVFRQLGALRIGDEVLVDAGGWRYRYQVRERINVWPTQTEVVRPTATPVLTLITCTAWDTQRLVVIADLVDSQPL